MKKLVCLFAVIALAAPLYAAEGDPNVAITCSDETGQVCLVSYQVLDEDGLGTDALVRGFAMDISVSGNATIESISGYDQTGTETVAPENYGVFISNIDFNVSDPNKVADWGDPVATTNITTGGLGSSSITVEMASLYDMDVDTPPAQSGNLFSLQLDLHGDPDTTVTIAAEPLRGGLVMEDVGSANLVSTGCLISGDCFPTNTSGGQQAYDDWVAFGKPDCWCAPPYGSGRQCYGDANGATQSLTGTIWVGSNDILVIADAWQIREPPKGTGIGGLVDSTYGVPLICADINHASQSLTGTIRVGSNDIAALAAYWQVREPPKGIGIPSDCPN